MAACSGVRWLLRWLQGRRHHIHPAVKAVLRKGNDMFARQAFFVNVFAAVGADIAVAGEQLVIRQTRAKRKGIDTGYATRANDAVDDDDGLFTGQRVVATAKNCHLGPHFPAHFLRRIMNHGLFK